MCTLLIHGSAWPNNFLSLSAVRYGTFLITLLSLDLTMNTCWCAIVTIFHVSAIVSGQTSCIRVTDPSVLEDNANMVLVDHVFYSEINSQQICGIRYDFL